MQNAQEIAKNRDCACFLVYSPVYARLKTLQTVFADVQLFQQWCDRGDPKRLREEEKKRSACAGKLR